jgi:branched-chain amino acid transport system permease protein
VAYYISTLLVLFVSYAILGLGLNVQYGLGGVLNFGYYLFFAIGAYVGGITALGSDKGRVPALFQEIYAWNLPVHLPYPLTVLSAVVVAGVFSVGVGLIVLRSVRDDFGALMTFVVFLTMFTLIGAYANLFNGYIGISGVPSPVSNPELWYPILALGWLAISWLLVGAVTRSPYGRVLKSIRERPDAAAALGKNVRHYRLSVFILGNCMAALSGALLIGFIGAWSPLSWQEAETLVVFSIVIVGGRGNNLGVVLGAAVVGVGINEAVVFLPAVSSDPGLIPSVQWVLIGIITIGFLWVRPRGLLPERKAKWPWIDSKPGEVSEGNLLRKLRKGEARK